MRVFMILLPALLLAQATPPKSQESSTKSGETSAKSQEADAKAAAAGLKTDDEKTIYAIGLSVYMSLAQFDLSRAEMDLIKKGMSDAAAGKPAVELNTWGPKIQALAQVRRTQAAQKEKDSSKDYLEKAAAEPGAVKDKSGFIYEELKAGSGESPKATDTVKVQYRGTLINGTEFDSSYKRNQPAQFPLDKVIKCWTEGVQKMKVGGKAKLVCPSDLAYGDAGHPPIIPGGATLTFEVELLEIVPPPPAPPKPPMSMMPGMPAAAAPGMATKPAAPAAQPAAPAEKPEQ
jgi:FKBP-type peptidyl-prolyl cis-trans isomerase FkpA